MKQILFFSALCYSLVMASCGGGATKKTSRFSGCRSTAKRQQSSRWRRKTVSATGARRWSG